MSGKIIISTIIAVSLAIAGSGSAFAQNNDHRNNQARSQHAQHDNHRRDRGHDHRDRNKRAHDNGHHHARGAGPHHEFHRGGHISREYRDNRYVVHDWRGHHLHQPPRGYQWVQTGPDFVLIAVTTGIIAQIVLSN